MKIHRCIFTYCTVKKFGGKKFGEFDKLQFANFHYFYNIPYANGLQFAKSFSAKLPTVLTFQIFLPPKFFTIRYLQTHVSMQLIQVNN